MTLPEDSTDAVTRTALPPIPFSSGTVETTFWKAQRLNGVIVPMDDEQQQEKETKRRKHEDLPEQQQADRDDLGDKANEIDFRALKPEGDGDFNALKRQQSSSRSSLILTQPPDLLRQSTINGNILVVTKDDIGHRVLIQRKLRQSSSSFKKNPGMKPEVISRVGYVLEEASLYPSEHDFYQVKDKTNTTTHLQRKAKPPTTSAVDAKDEMMRDNTCHDMVTIKIQNIKIPFHKKEKDVDHMMDTSNDDEDTVALPKSFDEYISDELLALQYIAQKLTKGDSSSNNNEFPITNNSNHVEMLSLIAMGDAVNVLPASSMLTYRTIPVYAITPYYNYGTLFDYLCCRTTDLSEKHVYYLFQQMLQALKTLNDIKLCHRNISLESFVLNKDDDIDDNDIESFLCTLTSFDYCVRIPTDDKKVDCLIQTPIISSTTRNLYYYAPELLSSVSTDNNESCSNIVFDGYAVDLWSCGIILFLLLFGIDNHNNGKDTDHISLFTAPIPDDPMYHKICIEHQLQELIQKCYIRQRQVLQDDDNVNNESARRTTYSTEVIDLLQGMLKANPNERYTLQQVLQHPWIIQNQ